ncbi:MAG: hypothetical protein KF712_04605 [Akkermansiaceae bacterium]|nr:hypothetical protein [Akkermansiaceae bacterium]
MPIRIEDIPNLQHTRLNQATMDPRVAGAPGAALEGLARDIASVSKPFADIANRLQDVKNADTEMRIRTAWAERQAAFGKQMADDPGGAGFLQRVDAFSKETSALLEAPGVPPEVRDRLRGDQQRMVHGMRIQGAEQASRHIVAQGRAAFQQRVALAVEGDDDGAIDREVDTAMARGVVPVAEGEKVRAQAKTARTDHQVVREIHANPGAWIQANATPVRDAPDFDEVKHANRMTMAKQLHLTETEFTRQEVYGDILSGKVTKPEEIDARTARLNPGVAVQLKEELSLRVNRQEAARLRTPEVQKELAGRISSRLLAYNLDAEDYDAGFTGIATDIGRLVDGPVKEQFIKELGDAREGKQRQIRTRADNYLKAIDDEWANHGFGRRMDPSVRVGPPAPGEDERNAEENRLAEKNYGEAKSEFIQWFSLNPAATDADMKAKAKELVEAYPREASSGTMLPAVPGTPHP